MAEGKKRREEGRGRREEGRGKREEGRGRREEGGGRREEGGGKREEGGEKEGEGVMKTFEIVYLGNSHFKVFLSDMDSSLSQSIHASLCTHSLHTTPHTHSDTRPH